MGRVPETFRFPLLGLDVPCARCGRVMGSVERNHRGRYLLRQALPTVEDPDEESAEGWPVLNESQDERVDLTCPACGWTAARQTARAIVRRAEAGQPLTVRESE